MQITGKQILDKKSCLEGQLVLKRWNWKCGRIVLGNCVWGLPVNPALRFWGRTKCQLRSPTSRLTNLSFKLARTLALMCVSASKGQLKGVREFLWSCVYGRIVCHSQLELGHHYNSVSSLSWQCWSGVSWTCGRIAGSSWAKFNVCHSLLGPWSRF